MKRAYQEVIQKIEAVTGGEPDLIANLSNISALLKDLPGYFWVGFYLVKRDELVLGPFQGSVACTRIRKGRGVCGSAWAENKTIIVADVDEFPGHIACSALSKSEVVVPIRDTEGNVWAVLDVDSSELDDFNSLDAAALEQIAALIGTFEKVAV